MAGRGGFIALTVSSHTDPDGEYAAENQFLHLGVFWESNLGFSQFNFPSLANLKSSFSANR
ncbi:MAG: hypothetical protein U0176_17180 [Bacteroidia bacterium]